MVCTARCVDLAQQLDAVLEQLRLTKLDALRVESEKTCARLFHSFIVSLLGPG